MKLPHKELVQCLRMHAEALALPSGRRVGQPGHCVARSYLLEQMETIGLARFRGDGFEQSYELPHPTTKKPQVFTNLAGVVPGRDRSLPPILLGAHYDSVIDAPCVDDNAASVAHNLVLAKHYALRPLERDVVVAFFDAEEPPFFLGPTMGSRRFCEDSCEDTEFAAVIVTDLVGHDVEPADLGLPAAAGKVMPHLKKLVAVMGAESDGVFPAVVEKAAQKATGLKVLSTLHRYVGPLSDHAAFAEAGHPFLFLSCGEGKHYHTPQDTLEWINFDKLAHITRFLADLMEGIDAVPDDADRSPVDPFEIEIRMLRRALGPLAVVALSAYGLKLPKSRQELDEFLRTLLRTKT